jgi:hypothetical protein
MGKMNRFIKAKSWVVGISLFYLFTSLPLHAQKFVGGDISLLPTYEEHGANYMDQDGNKITDMLLFLKDQGMNTMRVRLFVDPSLASDKAKGEGVRQDLEYVKALGKRIKDAGLNFMLDFHYSDTWADPGQQTAPASWAVYSWYPEETFYNTPRRVWKPSLPQAPPQISSRRVTRFPLACIGAIWMPTALSSTMGSSVGKCLPTAPGQPTQTPTGTTLPNI